MSALAADLPGARVVDLFAGSGALGIEALSRGAASATFVERAAPALKTLRANLSRLRPGDRARVVAMDVQRFIAGIDGVEFDVAFADPPYGQGQAGKLIERFEARPFAHLLCIEHRRDEALPALPGARERRYGDTRLTFIPAPE